MHPRVQGERTERAQQSIQEKAGDLTRLLGLDEALLDGVAAHHRETDIRDLLRLEGVAALLENAVAGASLLRLQVEHLVGENESLSEHIKNLSGPPPAPDPEPQPDPAPKSKGKKPGPEPQPAP